MCEDHRAIFNETERELCDFGAISECFFGIVLALENELLLEIGKVLDNM
jgi:hypothetical protein